MGCAHENQIFTAKQLSLLFLTFCSISTVCILLYLDSTGAAVESRGGPGYPTITIHLNVDMQGHVKLPVITENKYEIQMLLITI